MFTQPGDVVLDPLGGVGTVAFEACLNDRIGITNDLSPFASTVATAKVARPSVTAISNVMTWLAEQLATTTLSDADILAAEFGLNSRVCDYFHPDTLAEILKVRKVLLSAWSWEPAVCFVRSNLLHILHGNRPYCLSRNSHPITPFSPTGPFEYRSLMGRLSKRVDELLAVQLPEEFRPGIAYQGDFLMLGETNLRVDAIITSPPFVGLRFDRPNWMRMWLCGWEASDFHHTSRQYLERKQVADWGVYDAFFHTCSRCLRDEGLLVIHIGGSSSYDMVGQLTARASTEFQVVSVVTEDVSNSEKHGLVDKGTTTEHKYVFMVKRER